MTLTGQRPTGLASRLGGTLRRGDAGKEREVPPERAAERFAYPRTARRVSVHEPLDEGAPWIVRSGDQYIRVGADMARLLLAMDGVRDHARLVEALGPPWTEQAVATAVGRLYAMGLLDDGSVRPGRHRRRRELVKFVPPFTVQFTLLRPQRLMDALEPLIRAVARPVFGVLAALLVLGGLFSLSLQGPALERALGQPMPLAIILGLVVATAFATLLHELGHGATLTYYGGRPNRIGFMLFYMSPAFFCDVSDSWRLPHKEQRTRIALAGIVTQTVIGGSVALAALVYGRVNGPSTLYDGMVVFAVSTFVTSFFNFVPFVKLDGYLALMSHLDVSHLRDRAMTDARRAVARVLFGGRYPRGLPQFGWAVPFGLACMVFPLYLVGVAATLWADVLQALGAVGGLLVVGALSFLLYRAFLSARRLVREGRKAGASRARIAAACGLALAAVTAALAFVKVPYTVVGGFVTEGGTVSLVLSESSDLSAVHEGSTVRLQRLGVILRGDVGTATVASATPEKTTAPFSAFMPVRDVEDLPMPVESFPLTTGEPPKEHTGMATIEAGERPLAAWMYLTYIAPALR
ncbi:daptide biosynthesis intramembrane metalloprotease [Streptomyces sp. JJ38]|uniref:daptide biosynthesis intramembrane metalloprotease n=1 Tax=Streptomyces sp. JJ38 TaxID=2738128 RepID=UPI00214C1C60|nr:daptide biosynthesis intramembrane metalloprotease [Streptomyces sp. JJ38]